MNDNMFDQTLNTPGKRWAARLGLALLTLATLLACSTLLAGQ